ncbi:MULTISPECIES: lipid II flippase Amj family protein [Bacillus]|uniref:Lipid II flippase Amj n=2 Tax=Bacillus TaxID=1386 RepID=A0A0M5JAW9_9BACI|nr:MULTISPECIES: lipid II flippase Amj family protein [Bacillus]ALC83769.1 hypothetical protein AM592_21295 [Bacillus gobiensis]MBP1083992.1 hypothetical protein [Bacillus capparidis]MED1096962.1 lipid II flippase Amj family protein [Bacillus capparidis]
MEFITTNVIIIFFFLLLIHSVETLAYTTRLAGARIGLIASALSLFNVMVTVSRMSNMLQQPFTGGIIDHSGENALVVVSEQFRVLIFGSTAGSIIGMILLPTFIAAFSRAILHLSEENGSVLNFFRKGISNKWFAHVRRYIKLPSAHYFKGFHFRLIPKRLFVLNMLITSIYTIGVLSALYAGLLAPERSTTAVTASGLVNGVATILLALFVDPKISVLADGVSKGKINYKYLKWTSVTLVFSRVCGTILAQVLFIPAAYYIAWMTKWL